MESHADYYKPQLPDTQSLKTEISSLFLAKDAGPVKEHLAGLICKLLMRDEKAGLDYMEQFKSRYSVDGSERVSVLITSYNTGNYIRACLKSILLQTYHNLEIILVDDGSSDNTLEQVKDIEDDRLKVFPFAQNRGRVAALNEGLGKCTGAYIALMDSDDLASPIRIEKLLAYCMQHSLSAVSSQLYEYSEGTPLTCSISSFSPDQGELKVRMLFYNAFPHAATLFRGETLKRTGYREGFPYAEDFEMLSRYISENVNVGLLSDPLYLYRRRGDSATGEANFTKAYASQKEVIRNFIEANLFKPEEEELALHLRMERNIRNPETDIDTLVAIRRWIHKLLRSNLAKHAFDQESLRKILIKNYWSVYYYANTKHHGLNLALRLMPFQGLRSNIITLKEAVKAMAEKK